MLKIQITARTEEDRTRAEVLIKFIEKYLFRAKLIRMGLKKPTWTYWCNGTDEALELNEEMFKKFLNEIPGKEFYADEEEE